MAINIGLAAVASRAATPIEVTPAAVVTDAVPSTFTANAALPATVATALSAAIPNPRVSIALACSVTNSVMRPRVTTTSLKVCLNPSELNMSFRF